MVDPKPPATTPAEAQTPPNPPAPPKPVKAAVRRERKPLNTAQRVEVLLREGVEPTDAWMAVERWREPDKYDLYDADGRFNEVYYKDLHEHHLEECAFLRDVIKELREQVLALDAQLDARFDPAKGGEG